MKTRSPRSSFHHAVVTSFGARALDLARERERAAAHLGERPVRLDPAGDVDAAVAGGLRPADVADLVEHLVDDAGDRLASAKVVPGCGSTSIRSSSGLSTCAARRPGMEVDRGEVRRPGDVRDLGHAQLVGMPPDGNVTRATSIQSGRFSGTRFW